MIGSKLKKIIMGIMITSLTFLYIPSNTYHRLVERHKHKKAKIVNSKKLYYNLADIKFKLLKQQFEEMRTLQEYEKEQKLYKERQQEIKRYQIEIEKQKIIRQQSNKITQSISRGSNCITVRLSYYTNDINSCGKADGIAASGRNLNDGGNYVAAPSSIPFGTQLQINGKIYTVVDRGGAIQYKNGVMMLDVYVPNTTQQELNNMGVKYTTAKIVR